MMAELRKEKEGKRRGDKQLQDKRGRREKIRHRQWKKQENRTYWLLFAEQL